MSTGFRARHLTAALLLLVSGASFAQATGGDLLSTARPAEPPAMPSLPPAPASLRAAVGEAWQRHPAARSASANFRAAEAYYDAARQPLYNPTLDGVTDRQGPEKTATVGVSMALDVGGKRRARSAAARSRVEQAAAESQVRRRDFIRDWVQSWVDWSTAERRVRTGERRMDLLTRFADLAAKQFKADDISGLERDLALLSRDEAQAEQAGLLADRAKAEAALRAAGGDPQALAALDPQAYDLPAPAAIVADVGFLPDVQASDAAARAALGDVEVARRNRVPDPTVGVNSGRIDYGAGATDNVLGFTVSVPLFVRNSYRAEVVAAQAEADAAKAEADYVRLAFGADRKRAIDSYAAAQVAWDRWKQSRGTDVARRETLLERSWREGELSTSEFLLQLNQSLNTQLAGAALEAQVWRAYVDYLAAAGQLERWIGLEGTP